MVYRTIAAAGLAAVLGLLASATAADEYKDEAKTLKEVEGRVEYLDRTARAPRKYARVHRRHYHHHHVHHHRTAYRAWDGRYGLHPRRHFFITGVSGYGYGPVNVATVAYRTYVYYTPTYPSVSYGYPPYATVYDLTHGPIYNKPCFC
jgi:hypothetical protein